jgi:uncharacterized protein (DUF1684 family)
VDDLLAWRLALDRERQWREALYTGPDTPLSPDARRRFKGLVWFGPDPEWRLAGVRLRRLPQRKPSNLQATGPDPVGLEEIGRFDLELQGRTCSLKAYAPAPGESEEDYILVPFRDATSGKETYGAGRYLDAQPRPDDVYELDFNRAYAPYCAHDEAWTCTLPPPENTLPVRVEAGERL